MHRIAYVLLATLAFAASATAEPWWAQISFATTPSNAAKVIAAADAFMASEVGQTFPGRLLLQVNVADGSNPNTHAFVPIYNSAADREMFVQSLQGNAAWTQFQGQLEKISVPGGTVQYRNLRIWGDVNDTDDTWVTHALTVSDAGAYVAALDALMASPSGQAFPGQLYLSAVVAGGISPVTHVVSVGYDSVQEMADWTDVLEGTPDWASFQGSARVVSEHLGATLGGTVKTWGPATMQQAVMPAE